MVQYTFAEQEGEFPTAIVSNVSVPGTVSVDGTEYFLDAEYIFSFREGEPTAQHLDCLVKDGVILPVPVNENERAP